MGGQVFAPQSVQNFAPGCSLAPHCEQWLGDFSLAPQLGQNLALTSSVCEHSGQVATMVSDQFPSASFLSSSDISACAQISWTEWEAWAALISTPRSGAQLLHRPRLSFQHFLAQTQDWQRGHCLKFGAISLAASKNAASLARCQPADRARSVKVAAWLNTPPNRLLAVSRALAMLPVCQG